MKNLLLLFTIISLTACTSSDNDTTETPTLPTTAETLIGNWTSQSTDDERSFLNRVTFTEAGEMSTYISLTGTDGTVVRESVEAKTWTLDGNQITTTDTLEGDVDTTTVTVVNQDSIIIITPDGDSIAFVRDSDYESKIEGVWTLTYIDEGCSFVLSYEFTASNETNGVLSNNCDEETQQASQDFDRTGGILSGELSFLYEDGTQQFRTYFSVQGNKFYMFDLLNTTSRSPVYTKQ